MPIFCHDDLPLHEVPRIKTRILVGDGSGAEATAVWEQWIESDGSIPPHWHDSEETLILLAGEVSLTLGEATHRVRAPATIFVPPREIHALRPVGTEPVHLLALFPTASPKIFDPHGRPRPMPWDERQG